MNSTFALPHARQSLYAMLVAAVLAVGSLAGAIPAHAADVFLQGRVVDAAGKPLDGIQVSAFSGPDAGLSGVLADTTGTTNALGQYSLALSSDRTYRLRYADTQTRPDGPYITEWYQDAAGPEAAVPVTVTSPGITLPDTSLAAPALEQFTDAPVPVLSGTGAPGTVLTVASGTWSPEPILTYTWHRNGTQIGSGTSLTVSPTYGGGNITAKVTAKKSGFATTTRESAPVSVPLSEWTPPTPIIIGVPQGGSLLQVEIGYLPSGIYEFQWFADGSPITPRSSYYRNYMPQTADGGKRLSVQVTYTVPGFHPVTRTSAPTHPIVLRTFEPGSPTISGTAKVGETLTMDPGVWTPALVPDQFKVEWLRDGAVIDMQWMDPWYFHPGVVKHTLTAADLGKTISVKVTARGTGYESASATSAPTAPVAAGTIKAPSFSIEVSSSRIGTSWYARTPSTWTSGTTRKYQWYRDGKAVTGATKWIYNPTINDLGTHTYTVRVTASKPGYATVTTTTAASTVTVTKGVFSIVDPMPAPTGTKKAGYTLTAPYSNVSWSTLSVPDPDMPLTVRYQWYRGSTAIKGATGRTYKLTGLDAGKTIKVRLASSLPGYNTAYGYSKATAVVAKGSLKASTPTIAGTKKVGYRLTANPRTWTAGTKFTYQWYRSGRAIKGATGRTYKLVTADRYDTIKVKVTGYQTGYNTVAKTSAATSKVR